MSIEDHIERIHELPCVVCGHLGLPPTFPVSGHHLESVRDALSEYAQVPLCPTHHVGPDGVHGLSRRGFEARYKLSQIDLLALTIKALEKAGKLR
jgi:hypothetical protein